MFSPAIQRIVWKEFRAQQAVWLALAAELVLLQLWWLMAQHKPVNLFSLAFVLTGCFALTSSAMLFAGEAEAETDRLLRQLPFRSQDLIRGKLGFCAAAVLAFLTFATLTTLVAAAIAGQFAAEIGVFSGDVTRYPVVYANAILGLWAWGMFYSLVTRKVIWSVIAAAATEFLVNAILHGALAVYRPTDVVLYSIYWSVVAVVCLVDRRLLNRWYAGDAGIVVRAMTPATSTTTAQPLPWLSSYKIAGCIGVTTAVIFYGLLALQFQGLVGQAVILLVFLLSCAIATVLVLATLQFRSQQAGVRLQFEFGNITLRRIGSILGFLIVSCGGFALSLYATAVAIVDLYLYLYAFFAPTTAEYSSNDVVGHFFRETFASGLAYWLGWQGIVTWLEAGATGWLRLLQKGQALLRRIGKIHGSLLWIEIRRAVPVLAIGWLVLPFVHLCDGPIGPTIGWGYLALLVTSLICGLLTLLLDRSHGSLTFLLDRGVSAALILGSKVFVWGTTLLLLAIPTLLSNNRFQSGFPIQPVGVMCAIAGTFAIGLLMAAWMRRPILSVVLGAMAMILWATWLTVLSEWQAVTMMTTFAPIVLLGLGVFWTGNSTLLEQANWRTKLGRVSWVILVMLIALQSLYHFRANEIPIVTVPTELRFGQPSPVEKIVSSWQAFPDANYLDQLTKVGPLRSSLVQPANSWRAKLPFENGIVQLKLDDATCDLDAAGDHLMKWLPLTGQMSQVSRDIVGWAETIEARRTVLSAIRRWANHPAQTVELLQRSQKLLDLGPSREFSALETLARQYADAKRSLNSGNPNEPANRFLGWFLALTGEKERVRRLVDFSMHLQDNVKDLRTYDEWCRTTGSSASALGVSLPQAYSINQVHEQFGMALSAQRATHLTLVLQIWRLEHGRFPASLAEALPNEAATDQLSMLDFGYQPQGFDRNLQPTPVLLIPPGQPLLYSLGVSLNARQVNLSTQLGIKYSTDSHSYQAINACGSFNNFRPLPGRDERPVAQPAKPDTIRFVILGQDIDEDGLSDAKSMGWGQPEKTEADSPTGSTSPLETGQQ